MLTVLGFGLILFIGGTFVYGIACLIGGIIYAIVKGGK